jgi:hypothetical protein
MTIKQLLDSLSFDEIAPYIAKRYKGCQDTESVLASYKQHYDYLRHLVPTNPQQIERKEARISYYTDEKGTYLDAYPLEGDLWEDSLSKELIIGDEVKESNAEIAACCMWHMSFYGYLPYQRHECFDDMFDGIEKREAQYKAYKAKFAEVIPSEKDIMAIPSFHNKVRSELKAGFRKRKRRCWKRHVIRHTLFNRILYISFFIEDVLERGRNVSGAPTLQELSILYHANYVSIKRLDSTAFDAAKRFDYVKELIEKYDAVVVARKKMTEHANSFICLSASSEHPITENEKTLANILTDGLTGKHRLYIKTDESCGEELRMDIAFYDLGK